MTKVFRIKRKIIYKTKEDRNIRTNVNIDNKRVQRISKKVINIKKILKIANVKNFNF